MAANLSDQALTVKLLRQEDRWIVMNAMIKQEMWKYIGLIWATAEDLARNRGRVLSLYLQLLRSLNSPNLPLNLATRLHKKADVRAIFMLTSEERSLYNVDDLIDTGKYALSLLRKGEIPKYIRNINVLVSC
ncbi:DNA repair protein like [Heracleum sosnowskyi]|uniref:DNA repair protein like n=1 Tax=Heracleum sosnowskyi TaxID=360622 RepID=A0AAD8N926_9APIA|nr:DNA repair protein like [Heracleum sosnowskyi]